MPMCLHTDTSAISTNTGVPRMENNEYEKPEDPIFSGYIPFSGNYRFI